MNAASAKWHSSVTRYQWLVLVVASLGWAFDAFEGQLYTVTRDDLLQELLGPSRQGELGRWKDYFNGIFLLGSTLGGWIFASLADKQHRTLMQIGGDEDSGGCEGDIMAAHTSP